MTPDDDVISRKEIYRRFDRIIFELKNEKGQSHHLADPVVIWGVAREVIEAIPSFGLPAVAPVVTEIEKELEAMKHLLAVSEEVNAGYFKDCAVGFALQRDAAREALEKFTDRCPDCNGEGTWYSMDHTGHETPSPCVKCEETGLIAKAAPVTQWTTESIDAVINGLGLMRDPSNAANVHGHIGALLLRDALLAAQPPLPPQNPV